MPHRRTVLRLLPMALVLPVPAVSATPVAGLRVFRAPECGCCEGWAAELRRAGFAVAVQDAPDLDAVRRTAGVPADLAGCHTGVMGDRFVVEGHVPAAALRRFLAVPGAWRGLAVPGMPMGSPGMEMPGGARDDYTVFVFTADGRRAPFGRYRGAVEL